MPFHLSQLAPICAVINLDSRPDRWLSFQKDWQELLDFSYSTKRFSASLGISLSGYGQSPWFTQNTRGREKNWAGVAGATFSHKRLIQWAQGQDLESLLVLEDDAQPTPELYNSKVVHELKSYLANNNEWGICYLGYTRPPKKGILKKEWDDVQLWKVPGALAAHAYIIHQRAYQTILDHFPQTEKDIWGWIARYRAVDTWLQLSFENTSGLDVLMVTPELIIQSGSTSSIVSSQTVNTYTRATPRLKAISPQEYLRQQRIFNFIKRPLLYLKRNFKFYRSRHKGFPGSK